MPGTSKALQGVIRWDCAGSAVDDVFQTTFGREKKVLFFSFPHQIHLRKKGQDVAVLHFHHSHLTVVFYYYFYFGFVFVVIF